MSAQFRFIENENYKTECVLDSPVLVEDGIVWNQEIDTTFNYENDTNNTLAESNSESYISTQENSNDTQYYSILETTNEVTLNDFDINSCQNNIEESEYSTAITTEGQSEIYRIEGSDELYAFELACDEEGNLQRFRYNLRLNENGEYEAIPDSVELISIESPQEAEQLQIHPTFEHQTIQSNIPTPTDKRLKIYVNQEYLQENESILPDLPSNLDMAPTEDSNDNLQVNEEFEEEQDEIDEEEEEQYIDNCDTKVGILENNFLMINKFEPEENTNTFEEHVFQHVNSLQIQPVQSGKVESPCIINEESTNKCNISAIGNNDSERKQTTYEEIIIGNKTNCAEHVTILNTENTLELHSKPNKIISEVDDTSQDISNELLQNSDNENLSSIDQNQDVNESESDVDEFQIVDGIHITAESIEEHRLEAYIQQQSPMEPQILKIQQSPVLQSASNDLKSKNLNNTLNKSNKNYTYYIVKQTEKENVATVPGQTVSKKVLKTNPRSILKSSHSFYEQKRDKPEVQKIEKKLVKNKEAMQARILHNYIAKTTILHAPIRQQRLPRKQTIKPVKRADEEIVVQEVVVSSKGFIETREDGVMKSKIPLKPTEIVHLTDSDDDYDPKKEHKKKRKYKKRKSKVPEIIISDTENEYIDYDIVQIDLSNSEDEENEDDSNQSNKLDKSKGISRDLTVRAGAGNREDEVQVKRKRGRPPKRRNSVINECSTTDESSSSKKSRRNTTDDVTSNEDGENKSSEEPSSSENKLHNIKTKWKCTNCPKTFPSQGSLKSHMQYHNFHEPNSRNLRPLSTQTDPKPIEPVTNPIQTKISTHECSVCNEIFKNRILLSKHVKEHDRTSKSFVCSICKKTFSDKTQFLIHKRSHIKNQMFKTTVLPINSPKTAKLLKNKRTTDFKCEFCCKIFTRQYLLDAHVKTHKSFKCTSCTNTFPSKLALENHVRQNCIKQSMQHSSFFVRKSVSKVSQTVSQRTSRSTIAKELPQSEVNKSSSSSTSVTANNQNNLKCDNCSMSFAKYTTLFNHKVIKHGLRTPDKRISANNVVRKSLRKETGKYSNVPAGTKIKAAFSSMRSLYNK